MKTIIKDSIVCENLKLMDRVFILGKPINLYFCLNLNDVGSDSVERLDGIFENENSIYIDVSEIRYNEKTKKFSEHDKSMKWVDLIETTIHEVLEYVNDALGVEWSHSIITSAALAIATIKTETNNSLFNLDYFKNLIKEYHYKKCQK